MNDTTNDDGRELTEEEELELSKMEEMLNIFSRLHANLEKKEKTNPDKKEQKIITLAIESIERFFESVTEMVDAFCELDAIGINVEELTKED